MIIKKGKHRDPKTTSHMQHVTSRPGVVMMVYADEERNKVRIEIQRLKIKGERIDVSHRKQIGRDKDL